MSLNGVSIAGNAFTNSDHGHQTIKSHSDQFIGVAEEHGFINDLTRAVISGALAQARRWREACLALRVAINIPMDDLVALDFPEFVMAELARHGAPTAGLIVEVTDRT